MWNDREKIDIQVKFLGMVVERMTNTMAKFFPQILISKLPKIKVKVNGILRDDLAVYYCSTCRF